ncbi:MAG: MarR family transcriptional regulator, partial [Pseudomonadota bacterium]
ITHVALQSFKVPMAFVCFVDKNRVWFKSKKGVDIQEVDRKYSLCGHAITQDITDNSSSRIFEIPDTRADSRFADNPLVINEPMVRYYMGYVLQSISGEKIGTLCIMDNKPRNTDQSDKNLLIDLGAMIDERLNEIEVASKLDIDDVATVSSYTYRVFEEMNELLKKKGINFTEWRILDKVAQSNFATPTHIAKQLNIARSQVSKALELLEAKGLINRIRTVENCDRRLVKLECNEEGREIWDYGKRLSNQVVGNIGIQ